MNDRWYALYVRSRHEKSVLEQLRAKDQEAFLPLYSVRHRWADRWQTVSLPLFTGYVFCRFDVDKRSAVLTTTGVIDIVRAGREPAEIEDSVITAIQAVVKSPLLMEPHAGILPGRRVILTGGPLAGLEGNVVEVKKGLRFVVSVELLNRSVLVDIDKNWIAPIEGPKFNYASAIANCAMKIA